MKYQKKLNRLQKELEKTRDIYSKKLKELKEEYQRDNSADALEYDLELNALAQEAWNEERWCQHSIDSYITAEYKKDAERLLLPVPATSDKDLWEEVDFDMRNPEFILSRKGIVHMRDIIRKEESDRSEVNKGRVDTITKIGTMLIGLFGVAIGLLATFKN